MSDETTWSDYYRENEGREPRARLLQVLGSFEHPGEAVDLGCGAGIDTLAMLERGWRVFATDAEEEAIQRTRDRVPPELEPRLRTLLTQMEDVAQGLGIRAMRLGSPASHDAAAFAAAGVPAAWP